MDLSSLSFVLFLVPVLLMYWFVPKTWQTWVLLAASLVFYWSWQPAFGGVIFISLLISYGAGLLIEKEKSAQKNRFIFGSAVGILLAILLFFKYLAFWLAQIAAFSPNLYSAANLGVWKILLPLGISFYTFQTVGYLFDVYRGTVSAEKNFGRFGVFVMFFPKFIAGPIERSTNFLAQLQKPKVWSNQNFVLGSKLFALGLFKKLVVANNLAVVVDRVFLALPEYKGLSLILVMLIYSWQIYADFSGYTDIARGVAKFFGFTLLPNFSAPYLATSIQDFWRRWHISLSSWLRDYMYFPLGGSRLGLIRTLLNTFVVFVICGIWHGATWNFVVWGVFHGLVLNAEKILSRVVKKKVHIPQVFLMIYTYGVVTVSWIFFRAKSLGEVQYIFINALEGVKNFLSPNYVRATLELLFLSNYVEMILTGLVLLSILAIDLISEKIGWSVLLKKTPQHIRYLFYIFVLSTIVILRRTEVTQFIYVQF